MEKWLSYKGIIFEENYTIEDIHFNFNAGSLKIDISESKENIEIMFKRICAFKYTDENGIIDRAYQQGSNREFSSIYIVENSDYIKDYEYQSSGTRPMADAKHFIVLDGIDTVVEILSHDEPQIKKI